MVVPVGAEGKGVNQKDDRSAANRSVNWKVKIVAFAWFQF